jgi:hypothetical protein
MHGPFKTIKWVHEFKTTTQPTWEKSIVLLREIFDAAFKVPKEYSHMMDIYFFVLLVFKMFAALL